MNIQWTKIADSANIVREALRKLKGYGEKVDGYEVRSLIDYDLSNENYNYILHPSLTENNDVSGNPVRDAYIKQLGKNPRKDGVFGTCVITLPRVVGRDEEDFPDISAMDVEQARKAICRFYADYEKGKKWLEAAVDSFVEVMGIRMDDVLYAAMHMEETTLHVHVGFFPTYVIRDKDGHVKTDAEGNELRGCDRSIVSRGFLKTFHKRMVEEMKKRKQPYADALVTGEGYYFDPQKMNRQQRIEATREMIADEILQARVDKGLVSLEEADGQFYYKKNRLKNKDDLLKEKKKEIDVASQRVSVLYDEVVRLSKEKENAEKEKKLLELEMLDKVSEMEGMLSNLVDRTIREFQVELIGLSENDVSDRITVLCSELLDEVKREVEPIAEVLKEVREELSFDMDNDMEL